LILNYTGAMACSDLAVTDLPISVVILAGGQSRRLGHDKSLLELAGQPLIGRAVARLAPLGDDLVVVANDPGRYAHLDLPVRFVADRIRGMGSLMGIFSGLTAARHSRGLVVACDMPFLNLDLLQYMIPLSGSNDVVIPRLGRMLEPLHAIYSKACLPHMGELLDRHERKITAFFGKVRVRYVEEVEIDRYDPEHLSFFNVNQPEDWRRARRIHTQSELR
jgi:molybdopterin-guanine dinucleotide biosynthesis protein A